MSVIIINELKKINQNLNMLSIIILNQGKKLFDNPHVVPMYKCMLCNQRMTKEDFFEDLPLCDTCKLHFP